MGQCYTALQSMIKKARGGGEICGKCGGVKSALEIDNRLHED